MSDTVESVKKYVRAANYLAATQVYLKDNFLLNLAADSKADFLVTGDTIPLLSGQAVRVSYTAVH